MTLPVPAATLEQRVLTRDLLANLPEPIPLIDNTIDLGTVVVLAGTYGTLKSFITIGWACCTATAHAWNNRSTEPGTVLYIAGEGTYGLHKRIRAWELHHRITIPDNALHIIPFPVPLLHAERVAELVALVRKNQYRLVIVDTLSKSTVGMDENSSMDMSRAVSALYAIQAANPKSAVVAVHHTGKDRTTIRGSSALEAGVDTVYLAEGDAGSIKLSRTKRKDGPLEDVHQLRFEPVEGTESGIAMSDLAVIVTGDRSKALLSLFHSHFGSIGTSSSKLKEAAGMPDATFYRALNELVRTGLLVNTGTKARPFYVGEPTQ